MARDRTPATGPLQIAVRLLALVAVLLLVNATLGAWLRDWVAGLSQADLAALGVGVWAACFLYALLLAVPFVPGVEIGLGLLAMFGASVAVQVYLATVAGLTLAFLAGRLVPFATLARLAAWLGLKRASALFGRLGSNGQDERTEVIVAATPPGWRGVLLRYRYIAVAVLLNLPGNAVVGGGGGIALVAGASRLFTVAGFVLMVAIAVSPVPILVWAFGAETLLT